MSGAGSTSSTASGRILSVFEEEILAQEEKCQRWNVIDGRSYVAYDISEEELKKFIPDGVLNPFKCFEEFAIMRECLYVWFMSTFQYITPWLNFLYKGRYSIFLSSRDAWF